MLGRKRGDNNNHAPCSASLAHFLTLSLRLFFFLIPFSTPVPKKDTAKARGGGEEDLGGCTGGAGEETPLLGSISARACVLQQQGLASRAGGAFHSAAMG